MSDRQQARWKVRPEGSTWGDWGADDQLGRLNLLTPERRRAGLLEAREGIAFCLSLPLDYPGGSVLSGRRHPPQLRPTLWGDRPMMNFPFSLLDPQNCDIGCDDAVLLHLQYSTQWDSLAHMGQMFDADGDGVPEPVYYNGYRADEHMCGPMHYHGAGAPVPSGSQGSYAHALGIENMAASAVQGRAVLVDLGHHLGSSRRYVGYDDLQRILEADGISVEEGDLLCLRTGFDELLLGMDRQPDAALIHDRCAALDGRDERLLQWITDSGIAALISDNFAVEAYPARPRIGMRPMLPLHGHCLFKLGLPLGELWLLSPLAAWLRTNGRHRFLLTAPPLRLPGACGSPVTPVATV
ncbi:MAG: cyclase [Ramlibacter sp.]|nr:cyclase [Ramlibacter sp.]